MSDLMLDVGTANEFKLSLRSARGSDGSLWTPGDIKTLTNPDILGRILDVIKGRAEIIVKSVLAFVMTIAVPAVAGKKTRDCFTNKTRYYYRDSDLDGWLPEDQKEQAGGKFSVQQLNMPGTFKQAVESFLGVTGEIPVLAQTLRDRHCITTLPTIESLIERQEAGENVGLRIDGYANFFFVEEKAEEGKEPSVSVVNALRSDDRWNVNVFSLDLGDEWNAGHRFFFCN